jgi:hypothetical protein
MSDDKLRGTSGNDNVRNGGGLKRRDLLLSGSSLVAASALSTVGLTTPAQAQQPAPTPPAEQRPNYLLRCQLPGRFERSLKDVS